MENMTAAVVCNHAVINFFTVSMRRIVHFNLSPIAITEGLSSICKDPWRSCEDDHAFMVACSQVFMKIFNAKEMLSQIIIFHNLAWL